MSMIKLLREALPEAEIIEAGGSSEGIEMFDAENPDVILTDLVMPDMNGDGVVKHIRSKNQTCFVGVSSANIQRMVQEEMIEAGADIFLEKPISMPKINDLLEALQKKNQS